MALAVALATDDQGVGMMGEAVEGRTGQQVVVEDLGPLFESPVAISYLEYESVLKYSPQQAVAISQDDQGEE